MARKQRNAKSPGSDLVSTLGRALAELERDFVAGAIDRRVEKKRRIVDAILFHSGEQRQRQCIPVPQRCKRRRAIGRDSLIVEGQHVQRLVLAQIGPAETAVVECGDDFAALAEETEFCLDRIGADTLDLDDGAFHGEAGVGKAHGAEAHRNIRCAAGVTGEAVKQRYQTVEGCIHGNRIEAVGDKRVTRLLQAPSIRHR